MKTFLYVYEGYKIYTDDTGIVAYLVGDDGEKCPAVRAVSEKAMKSAIDTILSYEMNFSAERSVTT